MVFMVIGSLNKAYDIKLNTIIPIPKPISLQVMVVGSYGYLQQFDFFEASHLVTSFLKEGHGCAVLHAVNNAATNTIAITCFIVFVVFIFLVLLFQLVIHLLLLALTI